MDTNTDTPRFCSSLSIDMSNSYGTGAAVRSPTAPFSPISPRSPNQSPIVTPTELPAREPGIGLRQSSTNLAIAVDIVDINHLADIDNMNETSIDRYYLNHEKTSLNGASTKSSALFDAQDLLICLNDEHKQEIDFALCKNGYKKMRKICNTLQGSMYEATITDAHKRAKTGLERVAVKQTLKTLHQSNEAIQDELTVIVEENIIKEAMILKHLTKDNRPNGGYIAKFVDFFETDEHYYLVMEYVGDCNLSEFVSECQTYMKEKRLKLSEYRKVMKFLFWQICVMIHWMHQDMKCVHLDLSLQNIMVRDGNFIFNENNKNVTINPNVAVKLADFGLAEIFEPSVTEYSIAKWGLKDSFETCAPKVYDELMYDGMKSDIWSLGTILYKMATGKTLYKIPDEEVDAGYYCTVNDKLAMHLEVHRLTKYFNKKQLHLMVGMLNVNEMQRLNAFDVLAHPWFEAYYNKYAQRIKQKSKSQKIQLKNQTHKMRSFPYYSM